jgi:hypothetical protein
MLPPWPAPGHLAPTSLLVLGRFCTGPGRCTESYIRTAKIIWGIPVVTSTLWLLVGASACGEPTKDGRFIYMVAPNGDRSSNTSSRYPTIGRPKTSNA